MVLWTGDLERRERSAEEPAEAEEQPSGPPPTPARAGLVDRVLIALLPGLRSRRDGSKRGTVQP